MCSPGSIIAICLQLALVGARALTNLASPQDVMLNSGLTSCAVDIVYFARQNPETILSETTNHKFCCGFSHDAHANYTLDAKYTNSSVSVKRKNEQGVTNDQCCRLCYQKVKMLRDWIDEVIRSEDIYYFVVVTVGENSYVLCRKRDQLVLISVKSPASNVENDFYSPEPHSVMLDAFTTFFREKLTIKIESITKLSRELKAWAELYPGTEMLGASSYSDTKIEFELGNEFQSMTDAIPVSGAGGAISRGQESTITSSED